MANSKKTKNTEVIDEWADIEDEEINESSENEEYHDNIPIVPSNYIQAKDGTWYPEATGPMSASKAMLWMNPEALQQVSDWARDMPLQDVAKMMGINPNTLVRWKKKYPEFREALRIGMAQLDYKVENALLKRALGTRITETKTIYGKNPVTGAKEIVKMEVVEKEILPDPTSGVFWLNNRNRDKWLRNRDSAIELDADQSKLVVNIVQAKPSAEQQSWDDAADIEKEEWIKKSGDDEEWS